MPRIHSGGLKGGCEELSGNIAKSVSGTMRLNRKAGRNMRLKKLRGSRSVGFP